MTTPSPRPEDIERLLDAHLDRLDEAEQDMLRRRLQDEPALQACSDRLGAMLEPLDAWSVPPPPSGLVQGVLARLPTSRTIQPPPTGAPIGVEPLQMRRPFVSLREVLAVAACIVLFAGVLVPGFKKIRVGARQTACAKNLHTIYAGTTAYASSFGGQLPYAGRVPYPPGNRNSPLVVQPVFYGGQLLNSSHQLLLVRMRLEVNPAALICPSRPDDRAMDPGAVQQLVAFPSAANCSYDLQFMDGPMALGGSDPRRPWQSDANPFFDTPDFSATDLRAVNSRSHGQRGQNVLRLGGDVQFETSPVIGNDNIWRADDRVWDRLSSRSSGDVTQQIQDAFLVPGTLRSAH